MGAGPATLSAAIRLVDLCRERGIDPPEMLVIEKASEIGEHQLSGAVMKPTAIAELIPEWKEPQPTCAVLVPSKPRADLLELAAAEGVKVIWQTKGGFIST